MLHIIQNFKNALRIHKQLFLLKQRPCMWPYSENELNKKRKHQQTKKHETDQTISLSGFFCYVHKIIYKGEHKEHVPQKKHRNVY